VTEQLPRTRACSRHCTTWYRRICQITDWEFSNWTFKIQ